MPLYLDDKKTKLFKGDYKPMSVYLGDKKIAGYKYAEKSGEHIDFDGTYNDTADVVINGKSEQTVTVQGKNLFFASSGNAAPVSGMTRSFDLTAQTMTLDGTATATANVNALYSDFKMQTGKTYKVRAFVVGGSTQNCVPTVVRSGLSSVSLSSSNNYTATIIPERDETVGLTIGWYWTGTATADNFTVKIMVSETDIDEYEPFTPDSPSPDYPSPIKSVSDFDLVSAGRNLFDIVSWYDWLRTFTTVFVQKAIVDGISCIWYRPGQTYNEEWMKGGFKPNTQYTIIYRAKGIVGTSFSSGFSFRYTDGTSNIVWVGNINEWQTIVLTSQPNKTIAHIRMGYNYGQGFYLDESSVMLVEGAYTLETMPAYKPYVGSTTSFPYTLRSLPDGTRDYIEIDNVAKTVKLYRKTHALLLNGSEDWFVASPELSNTAIFRIPLTPKGIIATSAKLALSHFVSRSSGISSVDSEFAQLSGNSLFFRINKSRLSAINAAAFKAWLAAQYAAGTPVTVQYELASPIITEIDYEAVKTYYPYTQMYTTGSDMPPELDVTVRVMDN